MLHRSDLLRAVSTWPGRQNLSFAVFGAQNPQLILAVVPCQVVRAKIAHFFDWNAIDSMGGPAAASSLGQSLRRRALEFAVDRLMELAQANDCYEIRISLDRLAPANRGENLHLINPLLELGCENTLGQTWMLDLRQDKAVIWENMEKRARNAIRKAEKMGVTVREAVQGNDLDIYYELHCNTYHRTGVNPHPRAYFEAIWRDFLPNGLSRVFFAEYDGKVVAAENFGVYKKAAVYWTGAASEGGLEVQANSLLQWTAIQWMLEQGLEWYETGEGFPHLREGKRKGLNDFKKSFGGKLYPLYRGRIIMKEKSYRLFQLLKSLKP
ncbi:MAG: lipid II:glycine glycyltransferase FemX [Anaerolineaceae bacterium]